MENQTLIYKLLSGFGKSIKQENTRMFKHYFKDGQTFSECLQNCHFLGKRQLNKITTLSQLKKAVRVYQSNELAKKIEAKKKELDLIFSSSDLTSITINVEWKKNRTWGYNPTARTIVRSSQYFNNSQGTASGCGYDKESAAIAEALNQSDILKKALYTLKAKNINKPNRDLFGYGSGYSFLPYFEGGVGVSCYYRIFESIGFKMTKIGWGDSFDCYSIEANNKPKAN